MVQLALLVRYQHPQTPAQHSFTSKAHPPLTTPRMIPLLPAVIYGKGFETSCASPSLLKEEGPWRWLHLHTIDHPLLTAFIFPNLKKPQALVYIWIHNTFEMCKANIKTEGLNPQFISSTGPILQSTKPTVHFHQVLQISKILNESWKNDYESTVLFDCIILFKIKITIIKRPLSECNSTKTSSQKLLLLFMSECILNSSNHLPLWTLN